MLLHIDGSRHGWVQDERWYDLIVIRQQRDLLRAAGGGGIDADGDGWTEGSDRAQRGVLGAVQRPGQSLLADAEGGRESGSTSLDAGGTGAARAGGADDSSLLAAGAGTQRAQLRHTW